MLFLKEVAINFWDLILTVDLPYSDSGLSAVRVSGKMEDSGSNKRGTRSASWKQGRPKGHKPSCKF